VNFVGAVLVVLVFAACIHLVRLIPNTAEVLVRARDAGHVLRRADLDDDAKEKALQRHSLRLFGLLGLLLLGSVVALGLPAIVIWALAGAGVLSVRGVYDVLLRWDFLLGVTVLGLLAYFVVRRRA
jgi:hypothetical protein